MENIELFDQKPLLHYKLNQGIFKDRFYFGKIVFIDSQKTDAIILSGRSVFVDLSSIKKWSDKKRVPFGENELFANGFQYKQNLVELSPGWSNASIKAFLAGASINDKALFEEIRTKLDYYIDVKDSRLLDFVAVYIIATYCFSIFNSIGYLFFHSDKESGKTKFMRLIGLMCFNPINATNPSESALFRLCDCAQPTLLIDDYEKIEREKQAVINQILKVGYKRGGQTIRTEKIGNRFEPQVFDVYCPKVITNTAGLDSITLGRCIVLRLLKTKTAKGALEPDEFDSCWQEIRDSCHIFVLENWEKIRKNYLNYQSKVFNNRQLELVKGLLAVAETIDSAIAENLIGFLKSSFDDRDLQDISGDWNYLLFSAMLEKTQGARFYAVSEIGEWCRYKIGIDSEGKLNHWIGKVLSRIALFKKRRVGSGIEYFLSRELIQEYMELTGYPVEDTGTTQTTPPQTTEPLTFNGDKIKAINPEILDSCANCKQQKFVKYACIEAVGKNYCKDCVEREKTILDFA